MSTVSNNTPPDASHYISATAFELDRERIFNRTWHCVAHVSELSQRGDYVCHDIINERVFVVRDSDGELRGFHNLCRHRGHPLVEGRGHVDGRLICPYHAWTYELDGRLRGIPGAAASDKQGIQNICLKPVNIEVYASFVFVNLDLGAQPLKDTLSGIEVELESFYPDLNALRFVCETEIPHQCNWKISIENYNECYHCPTVHSSTLTRGVLSMTGYTVTPKGPSIWHEGKAQTENDKLYDYDVSHSERAGDYAGYWIWPLVSLCCYPGGFFTIRQWIPIDHCNTIYRYRWFSDGRLDDEAVRALMENHRTTTGAEDEIVVAKIQNAMQSTAFEPGPYVVGDGCGPLSEVGVRHFHSLYRQALNLH